MGPRLARLALAWALFFVATPGVVMRDGSLLVAILAVGMFGAAALRPTGGATPRRVFLAELVVNVLGNVALFHWVRFVTPGGMLWIALVVGAWITLGGASMRLFARRCPVSVSVCCGWLGAELLRTLVPLPFGLGWFLLGHFAHHQTWLSGSARVWGVEGLSLVVAALGGGVAALLLRAKRPSVELGFGGGALAVGVALAALTTPPKSVDGPRVLIVQPAFPQERKMSGDSRTMHADLVRQTLSALERLPAPPDLVCWGESMLLYPLLEAGVADAVQSGIDTPPWELPLDAASLRAYASVERDAVVRELLSRFPRETAFVTGVVVLDVVDDLIRRRNAVVLYDASGRRGPAVSKTRLVPGAETMWGLERFDWVRDLTARMVGYVPDLVPGTATGVLELPARGTGRALRFGATVCFDNAFLDPYTDPLRAGPLDFHLTVSNEAWYRDAFEMDQMIAFSRVACLATGRAMVRVTNSGVSAVLAADGTEVARLERDGRDRSVTGELLATVPVPADPSAPRTPYVLVRDPLRIGLLLAVAGLLAASLRFERSAPRPR